MGTTGIPGITEWAEWYRPWCCLVAVRLRQVEPEHDGWVRVRARCSSGRCTRR